VRLACALLLTGCPRSSAPAVNQAQVAAAHAASAETDDDEGLEPTTDEAPEADPVDEGNEGETPPDVETDPDALDDGAEIDELPVGPEVTRTPHPLDGVLAAEIQRRLREAPASLGSLSLGRANGGALMNGERLPEDSRWELMDPGHAYGTQETIGYLNTAIAKLFSEYSDTPPVFIGDISGQRGGPLRPHKSHQSGQDADVGYFYTTTHRWYQRASAQNLDRTRTWALVRALITETDVRTLFIDHNVQALLLEHALSLGEDPEWLESVFHGANGAGPLIRHAPGHATHLHVRFYNPIAEESARRCYPALLSMGRIPAPTYFIEHVAKKGDSLNSLSKRYGVSVKELRRVNGMRGKVLFAKKKYKVPRTGPAPMPAATRVPARRLPKQGLPRPNLAATLTQR
jgi:murein endopeptidase